ncbi:Aldo/keto reductase family, putative [Angomonas deanei]|uniref:Aldo/keto reductase family, putative n=1 Tax=Angomonas deanei TaxID=59799 RepID=A0A7G2CNS9_9TRYP|nr:Aldo/keto reductase family, putative [Angomonas deanei]
MSAMPKRMLGKSGLMVSQIGLGCMGMSFGIGDLSQLTEEGNIEVIHEAYRLGINFFDTAEVYGPHANEILVGKALHQFPRESLVIATKCGIYSNEQGSYADSSRETIRKAIAGSLERLQTSYVDLYYIHRIDKTIPIEEVAKTMLELKEEGKIRHWGLSEASVKTIRRAHAVFPLTAVQSEFSIVHRDPQAELLPTLEELGIGFVPFSPLCRALLAGAIDATTTFPKGDIRGTMPRYNEGKRAEPQVPGGGG